MSFSYFPVWNVIYSNGSQPVAQGSWEGLLDDWKIDGWLIKQEAERCPEQIRDIC